MTAQSNHRQGEGGRMPDIEHWSDGMPRADMIDEIETLRGRLRDADFRESGLHDALRKETAEVERLRELAQQVLDALDAEKTPDFGVGHDRAHRAALAMLGKRPKRVEGRNVPLSEIPVNER